jgi:hypothetical protein
MFPMVPWSLLCVSATKTCMFKVKNVHIWTQKCKVCESQQADSALCLLYAWFFYGKTLSRGSETKSANFGSRLDQSSQFSNPVADVFLNLAFISVTELYQSNCLHFKGLIWVRSNSVRLNSTIILRFVSLRSKFRAFQPSRSHTSAVCSSEVKTVTRVRWMPKSGLDLNFGPDCWPYSDA